MTDVTDKWNNRWQERAENPWVPDAWLVRVASLLPRGKLLDVACGRGRNALWLAEQGFAVTAVDIAAEGLRQLADEARRRKLPVDVQQVDLEKEPVFDPRAYAAVIDFFYLQRGLFSALKEALRPGGVAVVRTFSRAGGFPGGPANQDFVLAPGELPEIFRGWEILLHEDGLEPSSKGGGLAGIVARRPLSA